MKYKVYHSDCIAFMRTLPDNHVDAIVTDPPYELGFMGKGWDKSGIANSVEMWGEALRILKPGGHLLAFSGSRTYHRMTCAIEDAGFEIRDQIMWVYGSGFPKSLDVSKAIDKAGQSSDAAKQWQGWGTALKPAHEPICVARKPLDGTVAHNVMTWGTGGLNVDGCRVGLEESDPNQRSPKWYDSSRYDETSNCYGKGLGGKQGQTNLNLSGRWPANLIHDGSEEVVELFPEKAGANPNNVATKYIKNSDHLQGLGPSTPFYHNDGKGTAARFFYCAKASKRDRDEGCEGMEERNNMRVNGPRENEEAKHARRLANHHPTVKPTDLMRYLCRLVTPPGGLIFDPFTGSGSTGKAAVMEGFNFLGCDMTAEYVDIARARIEHAAKTRPTTLFDSDTASA